MDKQAAAAFVRRHGWLSRMPAPFQDEVIARSDLLTLGHGQSIYHAGDPAGGLFAVVAGRIEFHYPASSENPTLAYVCGPGIWAGDSGAVLGRRRRVTLIAGAGLQTLRLPRSEMQRITNADPFAWRCFADLLANNSRNMLDVIDALRRSDPIERIAMTLCNLLLDQPEGEVIVRASQADLGSMAQLGRGTVNAALADLEKRGLIRRSYAAVDVIDAVALRDFADGLSELLEPVQRSSQARRSK